MMPLTLRPPRSDAWRSWLALACLFAFLALGSESQTNAIKWIHTALRREYALCAGLPAYDRMTRFLEPGRVLTLAVGEGRRQVERKFCAQYALAPTPVYLLDTFEPAAIVSRLRTGPLLIDDTDSDRGDRSTSEKIDQAIRQSGVAVRERSDDGLVLLSLAADDAR
jgi:hypothetical protein